MTTHKKVPNERITLEMASKIQDAIDSEALAWMSDKGYQLSTHEKQAEFALKRNYHLSNTDNPVDFPNENLRNSGNTRTG